MRLCFRALRYEIKQPDATRGLAQAWADPFACEEFECEQEGRSIHGAKQDVPIDEQLYKTIRARIGDEPMAGLLLHLVISRPEGEMRYIDVWESEAACTRAFDERIHPAVYSVFSETGFVPDREPAKVDLALPKGCGFITAASGDMSPTAASTLTRARRWQHANQYTIGIRRFVRALYASYESPKPSRSAASSCRIRMR